MGLEGDSCKIKGMVISLLEDTVIRVESNVNCRACSMPGHISYVDMSDRLFNVKGFWNIKKCSRLKCGTYWLDPMPVEEDIHIAYMDYFTHDSFLQEVPPRENILYKVARGIVARISGLILKKSINIDAQRLSLSNLKLDEDVPGVLFEVGCGSGDFLARMHDRGWNVEGVDSDPEAIKTARGRHGLTVYSGKMENLNLPDSKFDVVTMSHVIEHVYDPIALLQECFRVLKPSGKLVIVTPNASSLGHQMYKENWFHLDPPRHISIYSNTSLGAIVKASGFNTVKVMTSAANAEGVLRGSCHIKKYGKHSMCEPFKIYEVVKYLALQFYEHILISCGKPVGEDLVCIAHK